MLVCHTYVKSIVRAQQNLLVFDVAVSHVKQMREKSLSYRFYRPDCTLHQLLLSCVSVGRQEGMIAQVTVG